MEDFFALGYVYVKSFASIIGMVVVSRLMWQKRYQLHLRVATQIRVKLILRFCEVAVC
jgi:hypothetical protein